jgi:hypothetical protein
VLPVDGVVLERRRGASLGWSSFSTLTCAFSKRCFASSREVLLVEAWRIERGEETLGLYGGLSLAILGQRDVVDVGVRLE